MWRDVDHGHLCDCMLLARAVGTPVSAVDLSYCRNVLQRHWRIRCNHGGRARPPRVTPQFPRLDLHDPVHAVLLANVPRG